MHKGARWSNIKCYESLIKLPFSGAGCLTDKVNEVIISFALDQLLLSTENVQLAHRRCCCTSNKTTRQ